MTVPRIAADHLRAYRRQMAKGERIKIRRGTGASAVEVEARARFTQFRAEELVGDIRQSDLKVIVMAEDLTFDPPVRQGDRVLTDAASFNIIAPPDDRTRRVAGVLIAYVLAVRG